MTQVCIDVYHLTPSVGHTFAPTPARAVGAV